MAELWTKMSKNTSSTVLMHSTVLVFLLFHELTSLHPPFQRYDFVSLVSLFFYFGVKCIKDNVNVLL